MSNIRVRQLLLFVFVGATIAGCETAAPPDAPVHARTFVGVISIVAGTNVFLNGNPVRSGTSVFDGDRVSTGPGSSAIVEFPGRGFVQFDENTDPYFEFLREGACVLIRAFRIGQLFAQGREICLQDDSGMGVVLASSVNWRIAEERSTLTVTDGTVHMLRPVQMLLQKGQQVTAVKGVLTPVVTLSKTQLDGVTRWRVKVPKFEMPLPLPTPPFRPLPLPTPPRPPPPPG